MRHKEGGGQSNENGKQLQEVGRKVKEREEGSLDTSCGYFPGSWSGTSVYLSVNYITVLNLNKYLEGKVLIGRINFKGF